MNSVDVIRWIGISHVLQLPLTLFLASPRGLDLRRRLTPDGPLGEAVIRNMAVASVMLPTGLGLLLALHAQDAIRPGLARMLGALLSAFWCFRLHRQLFVLHKAWPRRPRRIAHLDWLLALIFVVQGPLLAAAMSLGSLATDARQSANHVQVTVPRAR
jgi:hypothetical protein